MYGTRFIKSFAKCIHSVLTTGLGTVTPTVIHVKRQTNLKETVVQIFTLVSNTFFLEEHEDSSV